MISELEILTRLAMGALMGGLIGYERQVHGRPAGFRTHMLVCVASVLIMLVSEYFHYLGTMDPSYVRVDPGRIAAGAITGVGFLGAGVIVKMGATVSGLTTAASIWMVAAIGLAVGAGLYLSSSLSFVMTMAALVTLRALERKMPRLSYRSITVVGTGQLEEVRMNTVLKDHGITVYSVDYDLDLTTGETVYRVAVALGRGVNSHSLIDGLSSIEGVRKVSLKS